MKTSVERVDDTTVKLSVVVEADRVGRAIDQAARELSQQVRVPGFRPGRVPRRVLESRLGKDAVVQEAVRDALPAFYSEALETAELAVVGPPDFDVEVFADGQDASFSATVEVRPEVALPDLSSLQVPHPEWEVTDADVDQQLDELRERFAELDTVKRPVQAGDYVTVTVTGYRNGEKVDEASAEDTLYEVNADADAPSALDRNLLGSEPGAILKFRDDAGGEELDFTAIVKEVKVKRLPAVDDDFALTASEFDTADELRASLREQLAESKLAYARAALRGRVVEAVSEQVDVPLPKAMVSSELQFRMSRLGQQAEQYGLSFEQYLEAAGTSGEDLVRQLEDEARKTVKAQLVVDALGKAAGVEVTQEDLGAEIARQAQRLGQPPEQLAEFMLSPERIGALFGDAFRRKAIDHLLEQVQVLSGPPMPEPDEAADESAPDEVAAPAPAEG